MVLWVGDGDTIRVTDGAQRITIRLACIDAPESAQAPYGAASRTQLQQHLPFGFAVNLAMVQSGQAYAYRKYLAACDGCAYLAAEAQTQQSRRGVWALTGGFERPWDWSYVPIRATASSPGPPPGIGTPGPVVLSLIKSG